MPPAALPSSGRVQLALSVRATNLCLSVAGDDLSVRAGAVGHQEEPPVGVAALPHPPRLHPGTTYRPHLSALRPAQHTEGRGGGERLHQLSTKRPPACCAWSS